MALHSRSTFSTLSGTHPMPFSLRLSQKGVLYACYVAGALADLVLFLEWEARLPPVHVQKLLVTDTGRHIRMSELSASYRSTCTGGNRASAAYTLLTPQQFGAMHVTVSVPWPHSLALAFPWRRAGAS